MAFVERKDGGWRIRWRDRSSGRARSWKLPSGVTKREAERLASEVQLQVDVHGTWSPVTRAPVSLDEAIAVFIAEREAGTPERPRARPATLRLYRAVLERGLAQALRPRGARVAPLDALHRAAVLEWLAPCTPSTRASYLRVLSTWWRWAAERWPTHVQVDLPKLPAVPLPAVAAPTWPEIDLAIAQLTDRAIGVRTVLLIQRWTGLRVSQAAGLTWSDLVEDHAGAGPGLRVRAELGKSIHEAAADRWIPCPAALLEQLGGRRAGPGDTIAADLPRDISETARGAWKRAGVRPDVWRRHPTHAIRKRVISHLVEAGLGDAAIDHQVGHVTRGIRARHYIDPLALWPALRAALDRIPPLGDLR